MSTLEILQIELEVHDFPIAMSEELLMDKNEGAFITRDEILDDEERSLEIG